MKKIALTLAIAIAATAAPAYAGMFDAADKLETKKIQMRMAGKTEAEAKACTDAAWKAAMDYTGKGAGRLFKPSDVLDSFFASLPECK
jgi:hypothetical protein